MKNFDRGNDGEGGIAAMSIISEESETCMCVCEREGGREDIYEGLGAVQDFSATSL